MPKHWNIWRYDTFSCDILDPNAIPMLKYRPIDWACQLARLAQLAGPSNSTKSLLSSHHSFF